MREIARPGDILLYCAGPASSFVERLVIAAQILSGQGKGFLQYSHVSLVAGPPGYQIEAVWPRVRKSLINWDDKCIELRRIVGISDEDRTVMLEYARSKVGDWYDLGQFMFGLFHFKHAEICTTLVADAARAAGYELAVDSGQLLTPNELADDPLLEWVL